MKSDYLLSVIIPYFNTKEYCEELLDVLNKQMIPAVQVILIDDGSSIPFSSAYEWIEIYRKENGGVSSARNLGLKHAKGEYIAFIDSDDLVSSCYIDTILGKIKEENPDYLYMSWQSFGGWNTKAQLKSIEDQFPAWNLCCWNRIYKRDLVKDIRFNEAKLIAEDAEYIHEAEKLCDKKAIISDIIYLYRSNTPGSLTKKFTEGELNMQRIVYHYPHITSDMNYLIPEIRELNKSSEVIILTDKNDLPELSEFAMIMKPQPVKGTELRGLKTKYFQKIELPIVTQLVLWTKRIFKIGGTEQFIYYFCMLMKDYYDITVVCDEIFEEQIQRLIPHVQVIKNDPKKKIICDNIIVNSINDSIPQNIVYKKKIQMIHSCKLDKSWQVKSGDFTVFPSIEVGKSFEIDGEVIKNPVCIQDVKPVLRLISATRLTFEKGEQRIIKLAQMLNKKRIPFVWMIFSERPIKNAPHGIIYMGTDINVRNYISGCDYLVQLSDSESFCYSIVESLCLGIPVITTPLPILEEIGVIDGVNGFIVPFDMENIDVDKIANSRLKFDYSYDNERIVQQWKKILGKTEPTHSYKYQKNEQNICVTRQYYDTQLKRKVNEGETICVTPDRAQQILNAGFCRLCD